MKLARFLYRGREICGIVKNDTVLEINGSPESFMCGEYNFTGCEYSRSDLKLLSPCEPSKVICLGLNYRSHAQEMKLPVPSQPIMFIKPSTAVIAHGESIKCPPQSRRVDYEAELGVVIGKKASRVKNVQALDYVLGYTCANDVTARDLQPKDGQWTYAKGFDTFSPLGPWIETDIEDPEKLEVRGYLNGVQVQSAPTADHIFPVSHLIEFISSCMTLLPGDVIMTGTPSGIGPLKPGDTFEVEVTGVGRLGNIVEKTG